MLLISVMVVAHVVAAPSQVTELWATIQDHGIVLVLCDVDVCPPSWVENPAGEATMCQVLAWGLIIINWSQLPAVDSELPAWVKKVRQRLRKVCYPYTVVAFPDLKCCDYLAIVPPYAPVHWMPDDVPLEALPGAPRPYTSAPRPRPPQADPDEAEDAKWFLASMVEQDLRQLVMREFYEQRAGQAGAVVDRLPACDLKRELEADSFECRVELVVDGMMDGEDAFLYARKSASIVWWPKCTNVMVRGCDVMP